MAFLDQIASGFVKWAFNPLMQQLLYVVNVGESVKDLDAAMNDLKDKRDDLVARIEASERDPTQQRTSEVAGWIRKFHDMETEVTATKVMYERRCACIGGCSVDIYSSYIIGRKATKTVAKVKDLDVKVGAFISVTLPLPSPRGQLMPGASNLRATESKLKEVLDHLAAAAAAAADEALTVGIWGMGGVGKTALLKAINNKLVSGEDGIRFQHVIWVVVSSNSQLLKVQEDIAKALKLPFQQGNTDSNRDVIFNFLNKKSFVLLLDDVWECLDVDAVGIPDQRVVVFTTRSKAICSEMGAQRTSVELGCLNEKDAWLLFKDKVGEDIINSSRLIERIANDITKKCQGLPLALIVIARAMSSKRKPEEWQHTLTSLKRAAAGTSTSCNSSSSIQHPLFHILKYSYDSLPDETTKQCFLLYALFPEDHEIDLGDLIVDIWGHGLIDADNYRDIGQIFDVGHSIFGDLESACLLERVLLRNDKVKMHDVLRDLALWISCDCGENNNKWIVRTRTEDGKPLKGVPNWEMAERLSLARSFIRDLPTPKTRCDNLSTLMLQENHTLERIPGDVFQYFPALSYLDLSFTRIAELPEEVSALIELQYLNLSFTRIKSLSINLARLRKLKQLILSHCLNLIYIPYGLLSELPTLQLLDLFGSAYTFKRGISKAEEGRDENLPITEYSVNDESKNKRELSNEENMEELKRLKERGIIKGLGLNIEIETIFDLQNYVDHASLWRLTLSGLQDSKTHDLLAVLLKAANSIEALCLANFTKLEELIWTTQVQVKHESPLNDENRYFRRLVELKLWKFDVLNKITWKRVVLIEMFPRLGYVVINSCHGLRNLTWIGLLPTLHTLFVENCNSLEEIISDEAEDDEGWLPSSIFPMLEDLSLRNLPKLHNISKSVLDVPKLWDLIVFKCPRLKRLSFNFESRLNKKEKFYITIAESEWWEGLEWNDNDTKSYLQNFLHVMKKSGT